MKKEITYAEFLELCRDKAEEMFGEDVTAEVCSAVKNNGVELLGLLLKKEGEKLAPNFYLQHQYYRWCNEIAELDEIMLELRIAYEEELKKNGKIADSLHFVWENMKESVYVRLVGRDRNELLLKTIPYDEYLDMALIYHYVIPVTEETQGVLILTNEHLKKLGITQEELKRAAFENTRRDMPAVLLQMGDVVEQLAKRCGIPIPWRAPNGFLYVLSNKKGSFGAVTMLFTEVLERFSNEIGGGFYILPSSVHEVLLVPDETTLTTDIFSDMVRRINAEHVEETEVLTDSIYYYDKELHTVRRIA